MQRPGSWEVCGLVEELRGRHFACRVVSRRKEVGDGVDAVGRGGGANFRFGGESLES